MPIAPIDLNNIAAGSGGFVIYGEDAQDNSAFSVAAAGDVNGDGFDDLIIGAPGGDGAANGKSQAGNSYVVFGKAGGFGASIELSAIAAGTGGFVIHGEDVNDQSGRSVAAAGDVNGDGYGDLIVGAFGGDGASNAKVGAGDSYLVFGKAGGFGASVDLATIAAGTGGFVIHGQDAGDQAARSVASAGDVNGDGFDDLIIGARFSNATGNSTAGDSYVLFGKAGGFSASVDLAAIAGGAGGFVVHGEDAGDQSGLSVASAGDVNGDGFHDLIIGAPGGDGPANGRSQAGNSYVVFGKAGGFGASVNLAAIAAGSGGFVIHGEDAGDNSGWSVSSAGDVNGDGFKDMIVGAFGGDAGAAKPYAGDSYVVFGKAGGFGASVDLAAVAAGTGGFVIHGQDAGDQSGFSVDSAGDVNGDGFDDLLIGARNGGAAGNAKASAGDSYVVFGKAGGFGASINLADIAAGNGGFVIYGRETLDQSGYSVASAGDIDGDGFDDLLIGAFGGDGALNNKSYAGESYVVFGRDFTATVTHQGTAAADTLNGTGAADVMIGGLGDDILSGGAGNDVLRGGAGNDSLAGGTGADRMDGGNGIDTANYASSAAAVTVNLFTNVNTGGDAAGDLLTEIENVTGSALNDVLTGDSHANVLNGGSGADTINGGNGIDTADYASSGAAVTVNLSTNVNTGGHAAGDLLTGIENVTGSAFNDTLDGNSGNNFLDGGDGNDTLAGGGGDDALIGRSGADQYNGGAGVDTVYFLDASIVGSGSIFISGTIDRIADMLYVVDETRDAAGDTFTGIERIWSLDANVNDSFRGTAGDDVIVTGGGDDDLVGRGGADVLDGSDGFDTVWYESIGGTGLVVDWLLPAASTGEAHNDILVGIERIFGAGFNDEFRGGNGNEVLAGGGGNDILDGRLGDDTLDGGAGNDVFIGGLGRDVCIGQGGNDRFIITSGAESTVANPDIIVGFETRFDKIDLTLARTGVSDSYSFTATTEGSYLKVDLGGNGSIDLMVDVRGIIVASDLLW